MSKSGALDLASSLGGSIAKGQVKSAAEQYVNYHHIYGGEAESRKSNYTDLVLSILHLNILGLLASIKFINVFCFRTEDQICQFLLCESGKQVL